MTDLDAILAAYLALFPNEGQTLEAFKTFLSNETDARARVERSRPHEHVTASALFVDPRAHRVLLFHHSKYDALLQPGGHFTTAEQLAQDVAAQRLRDEGNIDLSDFEYLPYDYDEAVPIDIDSHDVPPSNEPAHRHHDLRYVFLCNWAGQRGESLAGERSGFRYQWEEIASLSLNTSWLRLFPKLQRLLSRDGARRRFYVDLARKFPIPADQRPNLLVVTHVLPDSGEFLELLRRTSSRLKVIPKPKSLDPALAEALRTNGFDISKPIERHEVLAAVQDFVSSGPTPKTHLLDIGGWFEPVLKDSIALQSVAAIVEDTRNGQDKYESAVARSEPCPSCGAPVGEDCKDLQNRGRFASAHPERFKAAKFPALVISVAESTLKESEDFLVGQSIVFSADAILRESNLIIEYLDCTVVGYGKVGRSIAHHLRSRGIRPTVVEIDPLRQARAHNELCRLADRDWANRNSDVVFCATGNVATTLADFTALRSGAFVFSVTSSDDEFDLSQLSPTFRPSPVNRHVTLYQGDTNHFYLVNEGNAVNFIHGAVLWEFIQLVRAALYVACARVARGETGKLIPLSTRQGMQVEKFLSLSESDQRDIARLWLKHVLLGLNLAGQRNPAPS